MSSFKPLLTMGDSIVIERVVRTFHNAGVDEIVVVVGHRAEDLSPYIDRLGCRRVLNEAYADGMFTSVQAGVRSLSSETAGFFVMPVDIPLVRADTITRIAAAFEESGAPVAYPVFSDRRGHPPLVSARLVPEILSHDGEGGLRAVLKAYDDAAADVSVNDEGILLDMDTPDDYDSLLKRLSEK